MRRSVVFFFFVSAWHISQKAMKCTKYKLKVQEMCIFNRNCEEIPYKYTKMMHFSDFLIFAGFLKALAKKKNTTILLTLTSNVPDVDDVPSHLR